MTASGRARRTRSPDPACVETARVEFLIRYRYPGVTVIGPGRLEPVGLVYVRALRDLPHDEARVFSHTKDPAKATRWPSRELAERAITRRYWPEAGAVAAHEAPPLTEP